MAMTVLITLTTAGIDSGPFNLYSDVDGYVSAFATGIGRATLLVGYSSAAVPDGTTIIRVSSSGNCTNYIDLAVVATTTTTTTGLTTTTTTFTTTTTTTGIAYNLSLGSPDCRLNNCGDGAVCAVRYDINVDNAPVGSYLTVTYNSGNASVSLYDSSPVSGVLEYSEPDNTGTVNFTLFLRDSGRNILTSITDTLSHESFWQFLSICPEICYKISQCTTGDFYSVSQTCALSLGDIVEFQIGNPGAGNIFCGEIVDAAFLAVPDAVLNSGIIRSCDDDLHCDIAP
jgi:hypothetical protein